MPDDTVAEAHAHFRLGQHLLREGQPKRRRSRCASHAIAPRLVGDVREAAAKNERGFASGPEFWARVDALGNRPYYPQADIAEPAD